MSPLYHSIQPSPIPHASGVYRIVCTVTNKFYIGSAVDLQVRRQGHFSYLRRNAHCNAKLQRAFNKYGEDAFVFEVLEFVLPIFLTAREQYWFNKLKPFGNKGFNIAPIAGSPEPSEETKHKMAQAQTGRTHSAATIAKMRVSALARPPRSLETCAKISAGHIGKPSAYRGKTHSAKSRENMNLGHMAERKTLIVIAPDGMEYSILGIRQFCREHNLDHSALKRVADGKQHSHKGWTARFPEISTD